MGCHFLLHGIFPTLGSNLHLLPCRLILYQESKNSLLSHQESFKGNETTLWYCNGGHVSPVQFSSVAQSCPTLCDPMNRSTPGLPVHHQLPESTQTHVHWVSDAIQPSHPVVPFSSCPQSLPASESFPMSQLFAWGGQSTGVSALPGYLFPFNLCPHREVMSSYS